MAGMNVWHQWQQTKPTLLGVPAEQSAVHTGHTPGLLSWGRTFVNQDNNGTPEGFGSLTGEAFMFGMEQHRAKGVCRSCSCTTHG